MLLSKELIGGVLRRFALFFDPPSAAKADWDAAIVSWFSLFGSVAEDDFRVHAKTLALKLDRFPVPADFAVLLQPVVSQKDDSVLDGQALGAIAVQGV